MQHVFFCHAWSCLPAKPFDEVFSFQKSCEILWGHPPSNPRVFGWPSNPRFLGDVTFSLALTIPKNKVTNSQNCQMHGNIHGICFFRVSYKNANCDSVDGWNPTLIFQLPIYLEPGVDHYLIYWQLGAWLPIYRELEDQGQRTTVWWIFPPDPNHPPVFEKRRPNWRMAWSKRWIWCRSSGGIFFFFLGGGLGLCSNTAAWGFWSFLNIILSASNDLTRLFLFLLLFLLLLLTCCCSWLMKMVDLKSSEFAWVFFCRA